MNKRIVGIATPHRGCYETLMTKTKRKRRTPEQQIADLEAKIEELKAKIRGDDRFSPEAVAEERERLGLSARQYGELVGVNQLTIYGWEKGKNTPRAAALQKWLDVRGIPKKDALKKLGIEDAALRGFSPEAVLAERERLELSAADYAELVGVSMLTIYNWEKGKTKPQAAQLAKWKAVKGIGKKEAWGRLGYA